MAEGVLGEFLGSESENTEGETQAEAIAGGEGFAAAIAAHEARYDPAVARATVQFLKHQAHLLAMQAHQLEEEHPLRIRNYYTSGKEGAMRRAGQRIRLGIQSATFIVVLGIFLGLLSMVHDAWTSHAVVVDAFDTPPALAPSGLNGKVVATGILDELGKMQKATRTATKGLEARSAWASDVTIEVPETGISIGEIDKILHRRLGRDIHISGDVVQQPNGDVSLTVRGDEVTAKTFRAPVAQFEKLTRQAAEYLFGESQPLQFANYLNQEGRFGDEFAFLTDAFPRAHDADRAEMANIWGNAYGIQGRLKPAAEKYRLAMAIQPHFWKAWDNLIAVLALSEGEESAWREGHAELQAYDKTPEHERPRLTVLGNAATMLQDWQLVLAGALSDSQLNGGAGAKDTIEGPAIADDYLRLHDPAQVPRYLAVSDQNDHQTIAQALLVPAYAALEHDDPKAAIPPLEVFWKNWQADQALQYLYNDEPCMLGLAYGIVGRIAEAEAVFKRTGNWAACTAMHGDALARSGDVAGAQRVWADGLKIGPDLSPVYLHRGLWELSQNNLTAAASDEQAAHVRSPHWADPLKAWGDVLAKQGQWREALRKYDAALTYAPAWEALHAARDGAASHQ